MKGAVFRDKKIEKKVAQCRKKVERGPFSLVQFRKCTKKSLAKAGTRTRDRWVSLIKICAKSGEVFGLTKKKRKKLATVIVGHFSQEKRRLKNRFFQS